MRYARVIMVTGSTFALPEGDYPRLKSALLDPSPFDETESDFYDTKDLDGAPVCFRLENVEAVYLSTPEIRRANAKNAALFDKERKRTLMELGLEDLSDDRSFP